MRDEPRPKQELYYGVPRVLLTSVWHKNGGLAQLFAVIVLVLAVQLLSPINSFPRLVTASDSVELRWADLYTIILQKVDLYYMYRLRMHDIVM